MKCFEAKYNEDTKFTNDLDVNYDGANEDYDIYRSASENGIDSIIIGEFSSYDGSGYVKDFYYDKTLTEFSAEINELFSYN